MRSRAGLYAANAVLKAGKTVLVVEAADYVGGRTRQVREEGENRGERDWGVRPARVGLATWAFKGGLTWGFWPKTFFRDFLARNAELTSSVV